MSKFLFILIFTLSLGLPFFPLFALQAQRITNPGYIPTGVRINFSAIPDSSIEDLTIESEKGEIPVSGAMSIAISPSEDTLLLLTSGYNKRFGPDGKPNFELSKQHIFIYDISRGYPRKMAVIDIPNSFIGIDWNPNGREFYVSGGMDDAVYAFKGFEQNWSSSRPPLLLNHSKGNGIDVKPVVSGIRVSPDGKFLAVANFTNDSISLIDLEKWTKIGELDLRPGKIDPRYSGAAGGEYPLDVAWTGNNKIYVSSLRDREIDVVRWDNNTLKLIRRLYLQGQPNRIIVNSSLNRAYVTEDNSDRLTVIDTFSDNVIDSVETISPMGISSAKFLKGASPNNLALDPSGKLVYVTNGGMNCLSVIKLSPYAQGATKIKSPQYKTELLCLIPTGWYPSAVGIRSDGKWLYVCNTKSIAGPNNDQWEKPSALNNDFYKQWLSKNQFILQKISSSLLSFPRPKPISYSTLTYMTLENNNLLSFSKETLSLFNKLHGLIHHVIYIIKENRGYDQLLGDIKSGNGDPNLAILAPYAPNHRNLATQFVLLDNFLDSGEVSGNGWLWSTAARALDITEKTVPLHYSGRGITYDWEGMNRNINVGEQNLESRKKSDPFLPIDPDILPGKSDISSPDGPEGEIGLGYLWDEALKKGITVRNYGFFGDLTRYHLPKDYPSFVPLSRQPYKDNVVQFFPTKPSLAKVSDPYYRGFDMKYPDFWRFKEWEREFDDFVKNKNLPTLELVRLPHDHFGLFGQSIDKVDTVETQMADNDYALGLLVQKVANSPYKDNTLIFVVEDDAQNSVDHVDAHRSIALVIGPFVKQKTTVSTRYTTISLIKTIEKILGLGSLSVFDQFSQPMTNIFDLKQKNWTYTATVPEVLSQTDLPIPNKKASQAPLLHNASFWEALLSDEDFSREDHLDPDRFNKALWIGFKGKDCPLPRWDKN
ncbi:hypothetical protein [Methylacidiphilum caldifontis]|uniref:Phosphoesterase n=1 Tax=Methylacidiphilum caldifontis TaxID=2795386 RepID=A0A4Y8PB80_9BACT|nr:hypothetical protein [Methylacidiphilum caldifontis]TFE68212.1 hypothetical protein A7Q10_00805 [Methylacidiphilum caldifontis]